jgi:hypothetical protein
MSICTGCKFRRDNPGDYHITCRAWMAVGIELVDLHPPERTTWTSCGVWPFNYDENIITSCTMKQEEKTFA